MTIKQLGGIFGRNPTFEDVTIEGTLTFDGDIDVNSDLKVAGDIETTGNVIIATSGKGIDFSATSGTGTSELFDDYEEGTWTPLISQDGNGVVNFTTVSQSGTYTKIGNIVIANFVYEYSSIGSVGNNFAFLSGLPFTSANNSVDEQSFAFFQQTAFDTKTYSSRKLNNNAKVAFQYDNGQGTLYVGAPFMVGNTYPGAATVRGKCIYIAA